MYRMIEVLKEELLPVLGVTDVLDLTVDYRSKGRERNKRWGRGKGRGRAHMEQEGGAHRAQPAPALPLEQPGMVRGLGNGLGRLCLEQRGGAHPAPAAPVLSPGQPSPAVTITDPRVHQSASSIVALAKALVEHDEAEDARVFASQQVQCAVCFADKPGTDCIKFVKCRHAFCRDCIGAYFEARISDGEVC